MNRDTLWGLIGILGIWITAGIALPFVNVLNMFTPEQLMTFRGFLTASMALIGLQGSIGKADRYTYLIGLVMPFATLGLFEGIRHWGAGPTLIVLTTTPVVNLAIGALLGRSVTSASISGLTLVLVGVFLARWEGAFSWVGFAWSIFGTVANAVLYELFARSRGTALQKMFWGYLGMGTLGLIVSAHTSWTAILDPKLIVSILGFAFVGGFLYCSANLLAFKHLPTTEASVLAQGETPAVILGATVLLDEHLTAIQWIGVLIALYGAWHLTRWLSKQTTSKPHQSIES